MGLGLAHAHHREGAAARLAGEVGHCGAAVEGELVRRVDLVKVRVRVRVRG